MSLGSPSDQRRLLRPLPPEDCGLHVRPRRGGGRPTCHRPRQTRFRRLALPQDGRDAVARKEHWPRAILLGYVSGFTAN
jgi:hypothetical protein